jgi:phospholipid transport system transporter-binding protein
MAEQAPSEPIGVVVEPGKILLRGDLVREQIERLESLALPVLDGQIPGTRLEIALGQVRSLDTAGVAFLLSWQSLAAARSVSVRYTHPPKALRPMMMIYGLKDLMTVDGL